MSVGRYNHHVVNEALRYRYDTARPAIRLLRATRAWLAIQLTGARTSRDRLKRHRRRVTDVAMTTSFQFPCL